MVTCWAVSEATSSASSVSRKSAYEASLAVASCRTASRRSRLLNSRSRCICPASARAGPRSWRHRRGAERLVDGEIPDLDLGEGRPAALARERGRDPAGGPGDCARALVRPGAALILVGQLFRAADQAPPATYAQP